MKKSELRKIIREVIKEGGLPDVLSRATKGPVIKRGFYFPNISASDTVEYKGHIHKVQSVGANFLYLDDGTKITDIHDLQPVNVKSMNENKVWINRKKGGWIVVKDGSSVLPRKGYYTYKEAKKFADDLVKQKNFQYLQSASEKEYINKFGNVGESILKEEFVELLQFDPRLKSGLIDIEDAFIHWRKGSETNSSMINKAKEELIKYIANEIKKWR